MSFGEIGLCEPLLRAVEELNWTLPTDIQAAPAMYVQRRRRTPPIPRRLQAEAIPLILGGGDVMAGTFLIIF